MKLVELEGYWGTRRRDEVEKEYDDENRIVYYLMTQEEQDEWNSYDLDMTEYPDIRIRYTLINGQGRSVIPGQFGEISLNKYLVQVRTDEGITLFDKKGKQVSSLIFDGVDKIKEGLIAVKVRLEENPNEDLSDLGERDRKIAYYNRSKFGFIDSTGKLILPLNYNAAHGFNQNRAPVRQDDKWGLINKKGEVIVDYKYDQLYSAGENRYGFRINKRWGLLDLNGREIIPAKYYEGRGSSYITDCFGGYSGVFFKDGKAETSRQLPRFRQTSTTLIDTNGVQLFPFKYKTIEE